MLFPAITLSSDYETNFWLQSTVFKNYLPLLYEFFFRLPQQCLCSTSSHTCRAAVWHLTCWMFHWGQFYIHCRDVGPHLPSISTHGPVLGENPCQPHLSPFLTVTLRLCGRWDLAIWTLYSLLLVVFNLWRKFWWNRPLWGARTAREPGEELGCKSCYPAPWHLELLLVKNTEIGFL